MRKLLRTLPLIAHILLLFAAALAPLMFLVGVIAAIDRWGIHQRMLTNLAQYGKPAQAQISYVDEEYNRAGLHFWDEAGEERYGTLDLRFYPPAVQAQILPDAQVEILYIAANVSESEKTVLREYYSQVQNAPGVDVDVWGLLAVSWLLVMFHPQFVFAGILPFDSLFDPAALEKKGLRP
jgi:hypothetical protein